MPHRGQEFLGNVLGGCTLERLLGQGGMGAVYLAHQERPSRHVAVKVLLPNLVMDDQTREQYLARFRREANIVARLEHVNIVPIYAYGEQDGLAYLIMPYLQGGSLYDVLTKRGRLSLDETIRYVQAAAAGLDYAHGQGFIHRDLKPANFLLHSDGRLLLSDFGLARLLDDETGSLAQVLTRTGTVLGTPNYMAPEMLRAEQIDHRADLYTLGIIIYQLLSGRLPFQGDTPFALIASLQGPPPPLHQLVAAIPPAVDAVVQRAVAKNREDRFPSAQAMVQALSAATPAGVRDAQNVPTPLPTNDVPTLLPTNDVPTLLPTDLGLTLPAGQSGSPFGQTDSPVQQQPGPAQAEERKLVSVLFADVAESATREDALDPQDIGVLVDRYYVRAQRVISDHGGMFEKFAGDAFLAVFGLPQAHDDDAERAAEAALALREALTSDQSLSECLQLQIGISTGEIVARSNPTSGKYDVKGETVNIATRLQQAADANEVLAGEQTALAVGSAFVFAEERQVEGRGRKKTLRAFPLSGVR